LLLESIATRLDWPKWQQGYERIMDRTAEAKMGNAIRRLRKERNLTIDNIAETTGLSRAYISQIETNKASPSLPTIRKICSGLGISPAVLFEDPDAGCSVIRADRRSVLRYELDRDGEIFTKTVHLLSPPSRKLELVILELSPQHIAGDHAHPGEEIFYPLEGEVTITCDMSEYVLRAGDAIHIDGQRWHKLYNHSQNIVRILSARSPPGSIDIGRDETLKRGDA
jgi:transcriptional regulator with XRE-family HTH domain